MLWTVCAPVLEHFSIAVATFPALVLYFFPSALPGYQVRVTMATVLPPHLLSVSVATVLKISGMLQSNRSVGPFKPRGFLSPLTWYLLGCFTWELSTLSFSGAASCWGLSYLAFDFSSSRLSSFLQYFAFLGCFFSCGFSLLFSLPPVPCECLFRWLRVLVEHYAYEGKLAVGKPQ